MNIKIDFGFGTQIRADGSRLTPEQRAEGLARIRSRAVTLFGGCTLYSTEGDWRDPKSEVVFSEFGATLSVLTTDVQHELDERVKALASTIKVWLSQQAVYVTRHPVQSELY